MQLLRTWVSRQFILCCCSLFSSVFYVQKISVQRDSKMRCIIKAGAFRCSRWPWTIFSIIVAILFVHSHTFYPSSQSHFICVHFVLGVFFWFECVFLSTTTINNNKTMTNHRNICCPHGFERPVARNITHKHSRWPIMDTEQHKLIAHKSTSNNNYSQQPLTHAHFFADLSWSHWHLSLFAL